MKRQLKDKNGFYTSYGVYTEVYEDMKNDLSKFKDNKKRVITSREFSSVVRLYFRLVVKSVLDGYSFTLNNRFGVIRIAKRKMNRFVPRLLSIKSDGNGGVVFESKSGEDVARKNNWFWHYLDWRTFKKYRTHEILPSKILKKEMMIRVNRGFEYIDYTPLHRNDDNLYKKV